MSTEKVDAINAVLKEIEGIVGKPVRLVWYDTPTAKYVDIVMDPYYPHYPMNSLGKNVYFLQTGSGAALQNVGSFTIVQFPGCCGITIATGVHAYVKGVGSRLFRICELISKSHNYTYMVCTDVTKNAITQHLFKKLDYEHLLTFKSVRTKNEIEIVAKNISK